MPEATEPASLGAKTATGASWSAGARIGQQVIQSIQLAVLARLLGPGTFGIMAMANIFTNFLQQIVDLGTGAAIIRHETLDEELLSSVFWLNAAFGLTVGALVWAFAPWAASFYREPQVTPVLRALAFTFLMTSMAIAQESLLIRRMEYGKLAVMEVTTAATAATISIVLAWKGFGVWSLVGGALSNAFVFCVLSWFLCGWHPSTRPSFHKVRSVASFSFYLTAFTAINYFARNSGHFLVGRFLGATALGYFQVAYSMMVYPIQNVNGVLGRVLFSAFSSIQNDQERFRKSFLRVVAVLTAITAPIMLGIWVTASPLVHVFLGAKFLEVIPLIGVLAPLGLIQAVGNPVGQIYLAKGRTDLMFLIGTMSTIVQVIGYAAGIPWGLHGVVVSYAIANLALFVPGTFMPFRIIGLTYRAFFKNLVPVLSLAGVMAVAAFAWKTGLEHFGVRQPLFLLVSTVMVGVIIYVALFIKARPAVLEDVLRPLAESGVKPLQRMAARFSPNREF